MKKINFEDLDVDLMWIHDEFNKKYISGFTDEDAEVILAKYQDIFITDGRYITQSKSEVYNNFEIIIIEEKDYYQQVIDCIQKSGLKKVGFEGDKVSYNLYQYMKKNLPDIELVPFSGVIEELRLSKSDAEIRNIICATEITEKTYMDSLKYLKEGITEKEYANIVDNLHRENGGDKPSFDTIVAFAANSAKPHAVPTNAKLKQGDLITLDFGCFYNGYCSDMTRTFTFGEQKNEELKKIHKIVFETMELQIKAVKPGVKACDIDRIGREYITSKGYGENFLHATGHGVGLEIHEAPRLSRTNRAILKEGMAITIEPGIYLEGIGGVRIENLVIVTATGCQDLNKSSRDINVLERV